MKAKIEQFPAKNPNPVFRVEKDGIILYSNEAGEALLSEWSVGIGEKIPLEIRDIVRRVYSQKSPERMKIKAGNKVYMVAFYPSSEEEYIDIYGFYIGDQKKFEGKPQENKAREIGKLELGKIIDTQAIQSLMNDFNKLVHIPMGLTDLKGNVLVSAGWQDICTKFHRINPETCKYCVESDINLSKGAAPGEYKLYRCKNNMWNVVTPIIMEGQHVGNILSGQFFFEDEPLDYELFRSQARKYSFNEEEYIKALEKVPRLSRENVNTGMVFFMTFANMISQLSYSNIKLSKSLAERDAVVDALRESERNERARSDELAVLLDAVPVSVYITHDPQAFRITGNRLSYEWLQLPMGTNLSKSAPEGERPEMFKLFKEGVELQPEDMPSQMAAAGREINDCELDIVSADGKIRHVLGNARPLRDEKGNIRGSISAFIDITEREQAEKALLTSEERYRMLFTNMTDGFSLVEVIYNNYGKPYDYRYLELNPAFELHLGVKRDDLLGKTMLETFPNVSPTAIEKYVEVALTGKPIHFETFSSIANKYLDIYTFSPAKGKLGIVLRDITESKQAEKALIQAYEEIQIKSEELQAQAEELQEANKALMISENEFRTLAENSPDVIARFDKQNRHLYVNPAAAKVYGYSQDEIIGKTHSELGRDPEQINFWEKHHLKVFDTGQPETMEFKFKYPSGKKYYFNTKIVPEFVDGKVISVLAISRDITDIKAAEAKLKETLDNLESLVKKRTLELEMAYNSLKESEEGLAEAQKMAHIGNWVWDIVSDKAYWSDELNCIFERSSQESAPTYNEYLDYVHPDDRDYVDIAFKKAIKGKPYSIDHRIILTNGEERTVHIQSEVVFDKNNIPIRVKGIVQDITERKIAEENIRTLASVVESSQDAILTLSLDGIITSWNKGAEQTYGYSAEEILGKQVSILEPDDLKSEIERLIVRIKKGIKIKNYETTDLKKDGKLINVSLTLSPIFDAIGDLKAVSVIARDITERIKAEKSLAKAESTRKKEIHHRIKNNLQVISSLLDLQADKFDNPKVIEAFRESQDRVISMALIHEELYKGERTDTLDFSTYIRELAENLLHTYSCKSKNIHLKMDLEENAFFDMDTAIPLGIIVNELVSNSLKHAFPCRNEGDILIKIHNDKNKECKTEVCRSTNYTLTVSDNGAGIPPNLEIETLDSLGLQLVISLVDQLEGELELKRHNGTEFTVKFKVTDKGKSGNRASNTTCN